MHCCIINVKVKGLEISAFLTSLCTRSLLSVSTSRTERERKKLKVFSLTKIPPSEKNSVGTTDINLEERMTKRLF